MAGTVTKKRFFGKSVDDNNDNEESGIYFNKKLRAISILGKISYRLAEEFFNILSNFESLSKKPLTIYVNSEGGDTYAMFKIYDHIRSSPLFITTIVAGCVSSAGFIILLAGDFRMAFPHAFFGFHAPTFYYSDGDSEGPAEAKESAFHQNCILGEMVKIVKGNSNMSERLIRKYFNVLTMIDAKTAMKFGLIQQIINPLDKVMPKSYRRSLKRAKIK